jgi:hypothetical protein
MAGGLLQLITSGMQDVALTYNPEITFFKKKYKRHTNFSLEIKEVYTLQQADYGNKVNFNLENADLIHRCFIQIDIPNLIFDDTNINNNNYLIWKGDTLQRINNDVLLWQTQYINFKNYVNIELLLYQKLLVLFLSDNVTLNSLKETVIRFNNTYKTQKNLYINLIDIIIFNKINMSGYILDIQQLLSYDKVVSNNNYISIYTIKDVLKQQNNSIYEYLNYYHSNWKENQKKYDNLNSGNINFAWTQYLAHYYFTQFELEIGGQVVESYSNDQFHIYQEHHLEEEQINNYYKMIGHIPELYTFDNLGTSTKTLLLPLSFWFCKNAGASLPLVAMRNTGVSINLSINTLKNILYFVDWEDEFNKLCILTLPYTGTINKQLNYSKYEFNLNNKTITYTLRNLNYTALSIIYSQLIDSDINFIINTFGNNEILETNEWIIFKNSLSNHSNLQNKLGGYHPYIDFNYLLNLVPKPKIKLLAEYVFIDDVERSKFAGSKLEYVIESFQENIFDIYNLPLYDGNVAIDRPNKYLKWFVQPKIFLNSLSEYGKTYPYLYNFDKYFKNNIFNKQIITLEQVELLRSNFDNAYYKLVTSYKSLNRTLPDGIYFYNFSLYPEETQPSGTVNLSIIKEKKFRYEMNGAFLKEYFNSPLNPNQLGLQLKILSMSYNFFVIENGIGRLIFAIA